MEKRAVIEPGRTPPEQAGQKTASELADHPVTRAADAVKQACDKPAAPASPPVGPTSWFNQ